MTTEMATPVVYSALCLPDSFRRYYSPEFRSIRRRNFPGGCIFLDYRRKPQRQRQQRLGARFICLAEETPKKSEADVAIGGIKIYSQIERLLTETTRQAQDGWNSTGDWKEIEGAWVLRPKHGKPTSIVHFVGAVFVGAAPQLTYRLFLECLSDMGALVVATPFSSGFDHFLIADEVQLKYDRCFRSFNDIENNLPIFGIGHSLGSVIHLIIGSRYAVKRNGNVLLAFNNKEASLTVPLFSALIAPMAQNFGPILNQLLFSSNIHHGAELAFKQLESLSPPIMKQVLPLFKQLLSLYMDLVNGREEVIPKPEEMTKLIKSFYGISRNLLIQFKDDKIDETRTLAMLLCGESAVSSNLDLSIRSLPGDHVLPLQQSIADIPPAAMVDAVSLGSELLASLMAGTPWEPVVKEVGTALSSSDLKILRARTSKQIEVLANTITSWTTANSSDPIMPTS